MQTRFLHAGPGHGTNCVPCRSMALSAQLCNNTLFQKRFSRVAGGDSFTHRLTWAISRLGARTQPCPSQETNKPGLRLWGPSLHPPQKADRVSLLKCRKDRISQPPKTFRIRSDRVTWPQGLSPPAFLPHLLHSPLVFTNSLPGIQLPAQALILV